jgi:hypothetical protein
MRPGLAMRLALRDLYDNSWRLVPVNAAIGAILVVAGVTAVAVPGALVLVVLAGPVVAALVHASVTVVRTGNVELRDAFEGLRLHWRRGLLLGALGAALVLLGVVAVRFYGGMHFGWPLVFATVYLVALLGIYQVVLWTLAIADPEQPLRTAAMRAAQLFAARPGATLVLGTALFLVNLAGVAAAAMPFLTITIAYSFLAAARYALPRPVMEEPT